VGREIVDALVRLRNILSVEVPARSATDSVLLATWTTREFDSGKTGRTPEGVPLYRGEALQDPCGPANPPISHVEPCSVT
jgi:hypothetical protein